MEQGRKEDLLKWGAAHYPSDHGEMGMRLELQAQHGALGTWAGSKHTKVRETGLLCYTNSTAAIPGWPKTGCRAASIVLQLGPVGSSWAWSGTVAARCSFFFPVLSPHLPHHVSYWLGAGTRRRKLCTTFVLGWTQFPVQLFLATCGRSRLEQLRGFPMYQWGQQWQDAGSSFQPPAGTPVG